MTQQLLNLKNEEFPGRDLIFDLLLGDFLFYSTGRSDKASCDVLLPKKGLPRYRRGGKGFAGRKNQERIFG